MKSKFNQGFTNTMTNIYNLNGNFKLTFILMVLCHLAQAQISGIVFGDIPVNGNTQNIYGVKDINEIGIAGVTVTVYPGGATTTTLADGTYNISAMGAVRIEFSNWPSYLKSSPYAIGSMSSVQFVTAPITNVNFGLFDPACFSQLNPNLVLPIQYNSVPAGNNLTSLVSFTYNGANGVPSNQGGTGQNPNVDAEYQETGAMWGLAYDRILKRMYGSTVLKRHCGVKLGLGYIYEFDYSINTVPLLGSFNLQGVAPQNGGGSIDFGSVTRVTSPSSADNFIASNVFQPCRDMDAFEKAGKVGIGDIVLSNDGKYMWAVNLFQKAIIRIDLKNTANTIPTDGSNPNSSIVDQYLLTGVNIPTCNNGFMRPWGLEIHENKLFIGLVCDGLNSQSLNDIYAYVVSMDINNPNAGFTAEVNFPLNYKREYADSPYANQANWHPWVDNYGQTGLPINAQQDASYPQAILSSIKFWEDGSMVLGFSDRFGHQMGDRNYLPVSGSTILERARGNGDMILVCKKNGAWVIEGDPGCPENDNGNSTVPGSFADDGPSGHGEYFYGDYTNTWPAFNGGNGWYHYENTTGALYYLKGAGEVVSTSYDIDKAFTQGVVFMNNDGSKGHDYRIYDSGNFMGKAHGLGDIEALSDPSPTEIGNRVWLDTDSDGIQDPGETAISGVLVELVKAGTVISTATTNATGNYYFSNDPTKPSGSNTDAQRYNISQLMPNMAYTVRIPNVTGGSKQAALGVNTLTTANAGGGTPGTQADVRDSDGTLAGSNAEATVVTTDIPTSGANNHNFDFGFSPAPPPTCSVSLTAAAGACVPATNQYTLTGSITFTNPPATGTLTVQITGGGTQVFNAPFTSPQAYSIAAQTSDGASHTVTATFSADNACMNSATYTAPVNCSSVNCPQKRCGTVTVKKN